MTNDKDESEFQLAADLYHETEQLLSECYKNLLKAQEQVALTRCTVNTARENLHNRLNGSVMVHKGWRYYIDEHGHVHIVQDANAAQASLSL